MAFIQKNVNFGLLFVVIILAFAIALIGIYYNQNYSKLSMKYSEDLENLQRVQEDLLKHKVTLNQTAADLLVKEQDETELGRKYSELREDKEYLDMELDELRIEAEQLSSQLIDANNELVAIKGQLAETMTENADLEGDKNVLCNYVKNRQNVSNSILKRCD